MATKFCHNGQMITKEEFWELPSRPGVPQVGSMGWPAGGRYVSGAANFPGDPKGFCSTKNEAIEKIKGQGKTIFSED